MIKLDIEIHIEGVEFRFDIPRERWVEGLGSDFIYQGRGGSGWSEKRRGQSRLWKGLVRY